MNPSLERLSELENVVRSCHTILPQLEHAADLVVSSLNGGHTLFACGNGGSACDALHLVEELVGRYRHNRRALPAVCLNSDPAVMTCISNDWDYASLFSRQVEALGRPGDILVTFSSSGNSQNLLNALNTASARGMTTLSLLGKDGGIMAGKSSCEIIIPSQNTARIQEMHTWILHELLEQVEERVENLR